MQVKELDGSGVAAGRVALQALEARERERKKTDEVRNLLESTVYAVRDLCEDAEASRLCPPRVVQQAKDVVRRSELWLEEHELHATPLTAVLVQLDEVEAAKEPLSRCMRAHERRTAVIAEAAAALAAAHPLLPRLKVCVCVCLSVCAPVPLSLCVCVCVCLCVPVHIHVSTHAACMHAY